MTVNFLDAAVKVLEEQGKPLHWTVIQDIALQRGYLDPFTQQDIRKHLLAALSKAARQPRPPAIRAASGERCSRSIAAMPRAGPAASMANAGHQPDASRTRGSSQMVTTVSVNPTAN